MYRFNNKIPPDCPEETPPNLSLSGEEQDTPPFEKGGARGISSGFSLLEVLVAFVVMGLVVGTLLQLFGSSMRNVALADEYSFAIQVAESRLAAVGNEIVVEEGSESGADANGYRWRVDMEPLEPETFGEKLKDIPIPLQIYRVSIVVTWDSGGKAREFHLSSLRFGEET